MFTTFSPLASFLNRYPMNRINPRHAASAVIAADKEYQTEESRHVLAPVALAQEWHAYESDCWLKPEAPTWSAMDWANDYDISRWSHTPFAYMDGVQAGFSRRNPLIELAKSLREEYPSIPVFILGYLDGWRLWQAVKRQFGKG
jgi:hypothetical protein